TLQTWEVESGQAVAEASDKTRSVTCLAFSSDGAMAAVGDAAGSVWIYDVAKGERIKGAIPSSPKSLADVVLTPDKKFMLAGDEDGEVKRWDLTERESKFEPETPSIQAHKSSLMALAVSPDGSRFASVDRSGQMRVWETRTGKMLREWEIGMAVRGFS